MGDEAYTSAALERLSRKGWYIADAGTIGIVGRYWNANVLHPQKSFDYFKNLFLLHLPADKRFLSKLAELEINSLAEIKIRYQKYRKSFFSKARKVLLSTRRYLKALPDNMLILMSNIKRRFICIQHAEKTR